jgi:hypothetical protein
VRLATVSIHRPTTKIDTSCVQHAYCATSFGMTAVSIIFAASFLDGMVTDSKQQG